MKALKNLFFNWNVSGEFANIMISYDVAVESATSIFNNCIDGF
jgi:hypothetical protein